MTPKEILVELKENKPELFSKVPTQKALPIIREVLALLGEKISTFDEGTHRIAGIGTIKVKNVEVLVSDEKKIARRVLIHPIRFKQKKA